MNTIITFTLTQLVGLVLAICAAIAQYYEASFVEDWLRTL